MLRCILTVHKPDFPLHQGLFDSFSDKIPLLLDQNGIFRGAFSSPNPRGDEGRGSGMSKTGMRPKKSETGDIPTCPPIIVRTQSCGVDSIDRGLQLHRTQKPKMPWKKIKSGVSNESMRGLNARTLYRGYSNALSVGQTS